MSNILFNHKSAYIVHKALEYKIQAKENMMIANAADITDSFKEQLTREREIFEHFTGIIFMLSLDKEQSRNINLGRKKAYILMNSLDDLIEARKKAIIKTGNKGLFANKISLETKVLSSLKTRINHLWGNKGDLNSEPLDRRYLDYYTII